MDETESTTDKEMNELCQNSDRMIEELQKTDPGKATDCKITIERLKVLFVMSCIDSVVDLLFRLFSAQRLIIIFETLL